MKPALKGIVTRSEIQTRYQSTGNEHLYPKLRVLMVELLLTINFIFQTITLRIQYFKFEIKMLHLGQLNPRPVRESNDLGFNMVMGIRVIGPSQKFSLNMKK